jgi:limonene-1,2-epoxide hydrolase
MGKGGDFMSPREVLEKFIREFNEEDVESLAELYAEDAVNHQVALEPVVGKAAIRGMFEASFKEARMVCIVENIFEDGEWAIMEWRDPLGLRGCGFFRVIKGKIVFQRGYWDRLTFLKQHGLSVEV